VIYRCCENERRRNKVLEHPTLNGIDFLEVRDESTDPLEERQRTLLLHFIESDTQAGRDKVRNALATLTAANLRIDGGERVKNIKVTSIRLGTTTSSPPLSPPINQNVLIVEVSARGDFSAYTLRLVRDANSDEPPPNFDPILSSVEFFFKVACPTDFDCKTSRICPPEEATQPEINYLAKDYASFKQLMLDRMALLTPRWRERNAADLGIALVELLAYVGDYLSYQQDAVATEAYLATARRRASVRRHVRLVDYLMHDGRNARAWVHFTAGAGGDGLILEKGNGAKSTKLLTKIPGQSDTLIRQDSSQFQKALNERPLVFELLHDLMLFQAHNRIKFYTWDSRDCCLPKGATKATLRDDAANRLRLRAGDVLIFEERKGPETGVVEDADPSHRHAVLLTRVHPEAVLTFVNGKPVRTPGTLVTDPLYNVPVVEIEWARADALPFPLCVSSEPPEGFTDDISVALGNIALADHGMTFTDEPETTPFKVKDVSTSLWPDTVPDPDPALTIAADSAEDRCAETTRSVPQVRYRPRLKKSPLTHATPLESAAAISNRERRGRRRPSTTGSDGALVDPLQAKPLASATAAIKLSTKDRLLLPSPCLWLSRFTGAPEPERWRPVRDLLSSHANSKEFTVEVETDGTAYLRFGDDVLGARPLSGTKFLATYRIGNGVAGNTGADTLAHIVSSTLTDRTAIIAVRNPLPAAGGLEPETLEEVRQNAPSAFRVQERAVTPADYEEIAIRQELADRCGIDVQRAAATPRWTGSWHTMFVTVDRLGAAQVDRDFEKKLRGCLERFRMAGEDLEINEPQYVSLEIEIAVCIKPGYYFSHVKQALMQVFSDGILPNNQRGLFHPDNLSFGQTVYLSTLIAAAQTVEGLESVTFRKFQRQHANSPDALTSGKLELGRLEIARLSNDPNFPERGSFTVTRG
jgi:hypothetical protein